MSQAFVIHVVTSLDPGGLERIVVSLVNERNRRFAGTSSVCCLDRRGELADVVADAAVSCLDARRNIFPWDSDAVKRLRTMIYEKRQVENAKRGVTDPSSLRFQASAFSSVLLHAHNMAAWQYAVLAARGNGAKVVYTQHGVNVHDHGFKNRLRSILLSWFTHSIVAVSENTADAMANFQNIPRRKIRVVRNGVDVKKFGETAKRRNGETGNDSVEHRLAIVNLKSKIGIPCDSFVVGSVGRLDYVKGYDRLISAFATLLQRKVSESQSPIVYSSPSLRLSDSPVLLLIGDGPERSRLEDQAKDLGVRERVIFAGCRNDVSACLGLMDLFVLPSRSEGLPVAFLEALAAGVPVAATEAGGSREVLDGGRIGRILPEDVTLWPEIIGSEICTGKNDRDERVRRGRAWVEERYSLASMCDAYEKIYEEKAEG